jgi:hypothetical protein
MQGCLTGASPLGAGCLRGCPHTIVLLIRYVFCHNIPIYCNQGGQLEHASIARIALYLSIYPCPFSFLPIGAPPPSTTSSPNTQLLNHIHPDPVLPHPPSPAPSHPYSSCMRLFLPAQLLFPHYSPTPPSSPETTDTSPTRKSLYIPLLHQKQQILLRLASPSISTIAMPSFALGDVPDACPLATP